MLRKWSLIGLADDTGVLNVGGRLGASAGPASFRRCWNRFSGAVTLNSLLEDFGQWNPSRNASPDSHPHTLEDAATCIESVHRATGLSVVVGGGHDLGYSHLLGVRKAVMSQAKSEKTSASLARFKSVVKENSHFRLGCINLDAHLDLRKPNPRIYSGSPFYLAIEHGLIDPRNLLEFGIQPQSNHPDLYRYAKEKKVPYVEFHQMRGGKAVARLRKEVIQLSKRVDGFLISLDLDCLAEAFAPGVSAPQAEGFNACELMEMMDFVGAQKKCISLGIFELNPMHDRDDQTGRVAATAVFRFLSKKLNLV